MRFYQDLRGGLSLLWRTLGIHLLLHFLLNTVFVILMIALIVLAFSLFDQTNPIVSGLVFFTPIVLLIAVTLWLAPALGGFPWVGKAYNYPRDALVFRVVKRNGSGKEIALPSYVFFIPGEKISICAPEPVYEFSSGQILDAHWCRSHGSCWSPIKNLLVLEFHTEQDHATLILQPMVGATLGGHLREVTKIREQLQPFLGPGAN